MSHGAQPIADVIARVRQFAEERDWQKFHDPKNLAMLLASEAGELLAEFRWVPSHEADAHSREPATRERIVREIGDVGIALLLLCDRVGVELTAAIGAKLDINAANYPVDASKGRAERPAPHAKSGPT